MRVASILPESSIDYPGKYGPVIFTQGCNFSCGFCHNPSLVKSSDTTVSEEDLERYIGDWKRKGERGWYNGITISGGEPTIHDDLPEFLRKLSYAGLPIKLDTNGSRPEVLRRVLDGGLVNYVAMDVKGPKELYSKIVGVDVSLSDIEESMRLTESFPNYEFRTTILERYHTAKNVQEMVIWVGGVIGSKPNFYLQGFKNTGDLVGESFKEEPDSRDLFLSSLAKEIKGSCNLVGVR